MKAFIATAFLFISVWALGGPIQFRGTPKTETPASGVEVLVYPEATVRGGGNETSVRFTGYGVRIKNLVFKIYSISHYIDDVDSLKVGDPMDTITKAKAKAVELVMLRDMSGEQVRSAFEDALIMNSVDVSATSVRSILDSFTDGVQAKDIVRITSFIEGNRETVNVEVVRGNNVIKWRQETAAELGSNIWKIWFGSKPIDKFLRSKLSGK